MIFIGAELSDPHAHFVTNIIASIGTDNDLIIDLLLINNSTAIFANIAAHIKQQQEQYIVYNAYIDESFFIDLNSRFPQLQLITVFSDDEWRHVNYDRYIALYSDLFTIAVKNNLKRYQHYGLKPFYMQWACNPNMFYPLKDYKEKTIDVSFIGAAYGERINCIRYLIRQGINIQVFGKGWDRHTDIREHWGGYVSHQQMLEIIAQSKINLNFLWTSAKKDLCTIKARTLEISACRAFQLSNHTDEFANYGFIDTINIALFANNEEMVEKIRYYLQHNDKRAKIAENAYQHVLKNHTWQQRFQAIFLQMDNKLEKPTPIHHKARILVLVDDGIDHQITTKDHRLDIYLMDFSTDWRKKLVGMDAVIHLDCTSTINNESLNMMVFALIADKSDMVVSDFYTGTTNHQYWIRIIDRIVEKKRSLLKVLPITCFMFSGSYFIKYHNLLINRMQDASASYIEYPTFSIKLPYVDQRKLRCYFSYHGDSRKQLKIYLRSLQFGKALALGVDKIWQKKLNKVRLS